MTSMIHAKRSNHGLVNPLIMVMKAKAGLKHDGHKQCKCAPLLNVSFYYMSTKEKKDDIERSRAKINSTNMIFFQSV